MVVLPLYRVTFGVGTFCRFGASRLPRCRLVRVVGWFRYRFPPLPVCPRCRFARVVGWSRYRFARVTGLPALPVCLGCWIARVVVEAQCIAPLRCHATTVPRNNDAMRPRCHATTGQTPQRCHATTIPRDHAAIPATALIAKTMETAVNTTIVVQAPFKCACTTWLTHSTTHQSARRCGDGSPPTLTFLPLPVPTCRRNA